MVNDEYRRAIETMTQYGYDLKRFVVCFLSTKRENCNHMGYVVK